MGVGISVGNFPVYTDIIEALNELTPKYDGHVTKYQEKMNQLRKLIHFRELRGGKDFSY